MKKEKIMSKNRLQRFGLVAGSLALGLVIGIYATFQFIGMSNTYNLEKIVDTTAKQMEYANSGASTKDAVADDNDKGELEKVLFERDKGGIRK